MHKRSKSPHRVIVALGIIGIALVNLFPRRQGMPVASACTLVWYAARHYAALFLAKEKRFASPAISRAGIAGCAGLFLSLPWRSVLGSAAFLGLLTFLRWTSKRTARGAAGGA